MWRTYYHIIGFLICGISSPAYVTAGELVVSATFEGGSAEVLEIDQLKRSITIRPAGDPQFGWPCWWYFQVTGVTPGEVISVTVDASQLKQANGRKLSPAWALPNQAAYSTNQKTWFQTPAGSRNKETCQWNVKIDVDKVWFAWGPAFVPADAQELVNVLSEKHAHATAFELCKTRAGRTVPALLVTQAKQEKSNQRMVIWVQARQHAWESGGSWVGRGFIEWAVSDDPQAVRLREKSDIYFIPIMDIDNVATGNGGKTQIPHDHNRDWTKTARWNSVKSAMDYLKEFDQANRLVLFVDLHNPGANSKLPYFYVAPPELASKRGSQLQNAFIAACRREIKTPFQLSKSTPSTGPKYDKRWKAISGNWVRSNTREHVVGITLETCWNTTHSNTTGYTAVGRQLGLGIARYLQNDPRESSALD